VSPRHDQKDIASYKECAQADGHKIWEQEEKMKDMERRLEADKAVMETFTPL